MTWWICGRGTPAERRYADTTLVPSATASDGGAMTVVPLSDAELDGVLAAWDATVSKVASADGYRPVFNETVPVRRLRRRAGRIGGGIGADELRPRRRRRIREHGRGHPRRRVRCRLQPAARKLTHTIAPPSTAQAGRGGDFRVSGKGERYYGWKTIECPLCARHLPGACESLESFGSALPSWSSSSTCPSDVLSC